MNLKDKRGKPKEVISKLKNIKVKSKVKTQELDQKLKVNVVLLANLKFYRSCFFSFEF